MGPRWGHRVWRLSEPGRESQRVYHAQAWRGNFTYIRIRLWSERNRVHHRSFANGHESYRLGSLELTSQFSSDCVQKRRNVSDVLLSGWEIVPRPTHADDFFGGHRWAPQQAGVANQTTLTSVDGAAPRSGSPDELNRLPFLPCGGSHTRFNISSMSELT